MEGYFWHFGFFYAPLDDDRPDIDPVPVRERAKEVGDEDFLYAGERWVEIVANSPEENVSEALDEATDLVNVVRSRHSLPDWPLVKVETYLIRPDGEFVFIGP